MDDDGKGEGLYVCGGWVVREGRKEGEINLWWRAVGRVESRDVLN